MKLSQSAPVTTLLTILLFLMISPLNARAQSAEVLKGKAYILSPGVFLTSGTLADLYQSNFNQMMKDTVVIGEHVCRKAGNLKFIDFTIKNTREEVTGLKYSHGTDESPVTLTATTADTPHFLMTEIYCSPAETAQKDSEERNQAADEDFSFENFSFQDFYENYGQWGRQSHFWRDLSWLVRSISRTSHVVTTDRIRCSSSREYQ